MKSTRSILAAGLLTFGAFALTTYTSCTKKDKCEDVTCQNGGSCVNGSCNCPEGWEGNNCQTASSAKFKGFYQATDDCPLGDREGSDLVYDIVINASNNNPTAITVQGLGNTDNILTATADGKTLLVAEQEGTDGRFYDADITYVNDSTLKADFRVKDAAGGNPIEACSSTLRK